MANAAASFFIGTPDVTGLLIEISPQSCNNEMSMGKPLVMVVDDDPQIV